MAHIKKIVMQGFKSFARRTEIPFDKGINIIIGPNGSGKSNISDAICFALGRLSVKSMRAEKTKNLIFMGSKYVKPAKEAVVEIHFDNEDKSFSIEANEIILRRIVRINGQSKYELNGETKTRTDVIETLAQAGVDPYGYNLILQGQIQSIVKMHPEERKKIIGEVAGISVYEWRKEKSLKELEKTDSRLKEISTILRERTSYMNNLEKEKAQAQRYKELQQTVRKIKASIISRKYDEKKRESEQIVKAINEKISLREKKQEKSSSLQIEIENLVDKINQINKHIKEATGVEQSILRDQITDLRAELEGLKVKKESHENRQNEIEIRIEEMQNSIPELEIEIKKLRSESPLVAKKANELKKKKEELAELEKEKKYFFTLKTELSSIKERIDDKQKQSARAAAESSSLLKQIEELSLELEHQNEKDCHSAIELLKSSLTKNRKDLEEISAKELENEKTLSIAESEIERNHAIKSKVDKLDLCPLCQSKITEIHVKHVFEDCDNKIESSRKKLEIAKHNLELIKKEKSSIRHNLEEITERLRKKERELNAHKNINEKKASLKKAVEHSEFVKKEIAILLDRRKNLESKADNLGSIEEKYKNKILEIEEISSRTTENIDQTLLYKERDLEKTKDVIERAKEDLEEINEKIEEFSSHLETKNAELEEKENQEKKMNERFKKMFSDRENLQKKIQEESIKLSESQSEVRQIEDQTNYLKIGKAKLDAETETFERELSEFSGIEIIKAPMQQLEERLRKTEETLFNIGSINMRALEVYEEVKKEYDTVREKVETLEKEKGEILKIIEEIDKKKKKIFMKTFNAINDLFSRNFAKLSSKGVAYLQIEKAENEEEPAEGGVDIVVRMAKGKYFDVNSLSGGEQTLVALSLLFAIQEHKPYHFYILDEIDAALDKRNSERLAALLQQYTKSGQYIIVTHNDAVILDSDVLYGVSMHEGVSKILSLRLGEKPQIKEELQQKNSDQ